MNINTKVSNEDILAQIRLSYQVLEITEQIILRRAIHHKAEQAGIKIEVNELQKAADDFRLKNGLTSARSTQKWLDIHQLSLDEFENIIRFNLSQDKLKEMISNDQIEKYFYQHQLDFDRVALFEVVLENKELAVELYYAVREGEIKFQDVASQYIQDVELRRKGGYLGEIQRKDLNPALLSVFFVKNPPQIIKPITTSNGFHLIWVEEIIPAQLDERIHTEIKNRIFHDTLKEEIPSLR